MKKRASWRTDYCAGADSFDDGYGVRIVLPIVPPSANVLKRKHGGHIAANIRAAVKGWLSLMFAQGYLKTALRKCRVQFVSYRGRELDADNIMLGIKPILDELVAVGLLRDDSPKCCDLRPIVQVIIKAADQHHLECYIESIG